MTFEYYGDTAGFSASGGGEVYTLRKRGRRQIHELLGSSAQEPSDFSRRRVAVPTTLGRILQGAATQLMLIVILDTALIAEPKRFADRLSRSVTN